MTSTDATSSESDPRIGTLIDGRYRLLRRLGQGGFGVVYEAEHEVIRRKVAVKMLHTSVAAEPEVVARFRREAIAATSIRHPHVVEVLDMGRADDGAAFMVLELLEGRDWASALEAEGPQPVGRVVRILLQVLDGLAAAHDKGIVHRDLKAENVFLVKRPPGVHAAVSDDDAFVKIVDFGISKITEEGGSDVVLTRTGAAMGTPVAMSPEQLQGRKDLDHRADLWSIGVMLFHALTGRFPFTADTFAMLAVHIITAPTPSLSVARADVPRELDAIVARLLEKVRDKRFESARDVRAALEPFAGDTSTSVTATPSVDGPDTRHDVTPPLALAATNRRLPTDLDVDAAVGSRERVAEAQAPVAAVPAMTSSEPVPSVSSIQTRASGDARATPPPGGVSPLTAVAALAVGGLLVGGTWWIASSRDDATSSEPTTPTTTEPTTVVADAGADAPEGASDALVRADDAAARVRRDPIARRTESPDARERAPAEPPPTSVETPEEVAPEVTTTTIGPVTIETPPPTTRRGLRPPR